MEKIMMRQTRVSQIQYNEPLLQDVSMNEVIVVTATSKNVCICIITLTVPQQINHKIANCISNQTRR